ncbi:nucleoside phosphorylase domain-containing protein [Aspergillus keveii]|uniref:Nucleoside phosphorylase domain-containing protein n=1 Tax=Aspergillus keveii TaxID=714993 RepID=A0ABR4FT07_9EURO
MPVKRLKASEYTVGIICCSPAALAACKFMLDKEHGRPLMEPGNVCKGVYNAGTIHSHNVVITSLPLGYSGSTSVATAAHCMALLFPSLELRFLVGVGGGNVVVNTTYGGVVQYDREQRKPSPPQSEWIDVVANTSYNGVVQYNGLEWELCPSEWLDALNKIMADQAEQGCNRITENISALTERDCLTKHRRPEVDVLFRANSHHVKDANTCDGCDERCIIPRPARKHNNPVIHYGMIACGDRVIEAGLKRDQISMELGGAICLSTETADLYDAPYIAICGISSYADSHGSDTWGPYAAAAAAGFAKEMLLCL